jgi:sec-independent protein translocase protein TatA
MTPGPLQILLIIVVILLLFGAGRVPGIMENIAKGVKSFKSGLKDEEESQKPGISESQKEDE